MLIDNKVIIGIKATKRLIEKNEAQLLNYLKATDMNLDSYLISL
ncbi:MAG TPA: GxxExxY protein [Nitrospinota bacterium]|nr:GxxExxY protein [Nitrospinota bacterium]